MTILKLQSLSDIKSVARNFLKLMANNKVFAFYGEMGAGKTTFIKAVCIAMGVTDNITSPTFALINEYLDKNGETIYHFDCYRLKNIAEANDIGAEEYLYSNNVCFIEWPENIEELLPQNRVNVTIKVMPDLQREITINIV